MDKQKKERIISAYSVDAFKKNGYKIIDMISEYYNKTGVEERKKMFCNKTPAEIEKIYDSDFQKPFKGEFSEELNSLLENITPLHHPNYLGHQIAPPLPTASLSDLVMATLNNSNCVFEMGKAAAGMEKAIIKWMCKKVGYDKKSDGVLTSGGTAGNLTAMLAARQNRVGYDIWEKGVQENNLCVLVSEEAHYSISRAISIMGLGSDNAIKIPCREDFKLDVEKLKQIYEKVTAEGKKVFAVAASACSTATGKFDDIEEIAEFCQEKNLWFHVDGAHGGPTLLSDKYKKLYMKGLEKADSFVWDAHKMMMFPALVTGVLFKNGKVTYSTFTQEASYILDRTFEENWFDYGLRTIEATKPFLSLKLYSNLKYYGESFFGDFVEVMYDLTKEFADIIEKSDDFELATKTESNIICFRYIGKKTDDINLLQDKIRNELLKRQDFYIVKTTLRGKLYLRCTIINPRTELSHLENLLNNIREIAKVVE